MKVDLTYAALAATAITGVTAPLLFTAQFPVALKTISLVSGIAASGALAYGHQSGVFEREREWNGMQRASRQRIREEALISRELRETKRLEFEDLKEILIMLDELTPTEQRYFLGQLGLSELIDLYQPALPELIEQPQAIEVPALAVKQPEPEFAGRLEWAVQNVVSQALQAQQPTADVVDETFKEVDLGRAVAVMMTSGDVPLCVMVACAPRTGKTTLLTVMIAWLHKLTDGGAQVRIWNAKEKRNIDTGELEDKFLGLVDDPDRYYAIKTPEQAKHFAEQYHKGTLEMDKPRRYPDVDIVDEMNNARALVEVYDIQNGLTKNHAKLTQLDSNSSFRVTQGTSRNKFTIITAHSSYVSEVGINRSLQDGVYSIVLGRGATLDPIYKALRGTTAIVRNSVLAKKLLTALEEWENSPTRDHSKVVALTNLIDGVYGLYFVKYVDLSNVEFAPITEQPAPPQNDPYEFWDEQFEDNAGHQPEDDPDWEKTKPTKPQKPVLTQEELTAALLEWMGKSTPTDEQLRAKVEELLGGTISDDMLIGIKWLIEEARKGYKPYGSDNKPKS